MLARGYQEGRPCGCGGERERKEAECPRDWKSTDQNVIFKGVYNVKVIADDKTSNTWMRCDNSH